MCVIIESFILFRHLTFLFLKEVKVRQRWWFWCYHRGATKTRHSGFNFNNRHLKTQSYHNEAMKVGFGVHVAVGLFLSSLACVPTASAHQRLLLVPPSCHPLHGGQRGEKETLAQGGRAEIRSLIIIIIIIIIISTGNTYHCTFHSGYEPFSAIQHGYHLN